MKDMGRRGFLGLAFAAGATAVTASLIGRAEAAGLASSVDTAVPGSTTAAGVTQSAESAMEPTQAIVIRPGARRPVVIRPGWRRRRPARRRCWRNRWGRLICSN